MKYGKFITFDREIADEAFAFLFSYCDRIEYLSEYQYGHFADISELAGTELEGMISACVRSHEGESWGMKGTLHVFSLTDGVKSIVKKYGLYSSLFAADSLVLQNATLYRGEIALFSVCSHEGYDFYEDEFKERFGEVCCRAIEKTEAYREAREAYSRTAERKHRTREKKILRAVECYVAKDSEAALYFTPPEPCSYRRFLELAKLYLSSETVRELNRAKRFSELHPEGYAKTLEEIGTYQGVPRFEESELYAKIRRELFFLDYAEEKSRDGN